MKIFLASFLQPQNFGPGRVISIADSKPEHIKPEPKLFLPLMPPVDLISRYNNLSLQDPKKASEMFVEEYKTQLKSFYKDVKLTCRELNKTPQEVLPFEDGDTLASWQRAEFTHYRKYLKPLLEKLGYEVVSN